MFNAMTSVIQGIKAVGGYVMLNGGITYLTDLIIPHKVQLGAYKDSKNAKRMEKALKSKNFGAATVEMDNLKKVQSGAFSKKDGADQLVKKLHAAGFGTAKRITLFDGKASAFIDGVTQEEVFFADHGLQRHRNIREAITGRIRTLPGAHAPACEERDRLLSPGIHKKQHAQAPDQSIL